MMNSYAVLWLFLGIVLMYPSSSFSSINGNSRTLDDRETTYNVTVKLIDSVQEGKYTVKLKCRPRTFDIITCRLYDPKYETRCKTVCGSPTFSIKEQLFSDNSRFVGNFEVKFRGSIVERITVSSSTPAHQIGFFRIIANLLFLGVDVRDKSHGKFTMMERSVYGICEALVDIVRNLRLDDTGESPHQTVSVKRTRNFKNCCPIHGLPISSLFFHSPMKAHFDYKFVSSISDFVISDNTFTSYTTEVLALKSGNAIETLEVHATLTQVSLKKTTDAVFFITDPISVKLAFFDFDTSNKC